MIKILLNKFQYLLKMSRVHTFEFDDEFYANESNFKIYVYKNVKNKNCNQILKTLKNNFMIN